MLSKKEVLSIIKYELRANKLSTKVRFLNEKEFLKHAKKSPIISRSLTEGNSLQDLNIPALFSL